MTGDPPQALNCAGQGVSPTSLLPPKIPPHFSFQPVAPPRIYPAKRKSKKKLEVDVSTEVSSLKSQVSTLQQQTLYLRENLEEERQQRKQFEQLLRRTLTKALPDIDLGPDPRMSFRTSQAGL